MFGLSVNVFVGRLLVAYINVSLFCHCILCVCVILVYFIVSLYM